MGHGLDPTRRARLRRLAALALLSLLGMPGTSLAQAAPDPLFDAFASPPQRLRPFVRWWWNGARVAEPEVLRELDVMKAAGGPVSFEAMTNAVPVFREMPEDFKLGMDQSALAGVQQPILHGFNYSPREAGFPGWVRFGSWWSEQNPWWPHVRRFTDYAARLTAVLSSSEFQAKVALLGPKADEWARDGLLYQPFPEASRPWYHYHLWQALQEAGYGTDFVSEGVLRGAHVEGGRITYGARAYDTLVVMDVASLEPETAEAIARFGEAGGRIVFVGRSPDRAPGLKDAALADRRVKEAIARLLASRAGQAVVVPAPSQGLLPPRDYTRGELPDGARRELLRWVLATLPPLGARPDVRLAAPHEDVGLVHHRAGDRGIFFFANASRTEARDVEALFPTGQARPWRWDLETGTRAPMPLSGRPDTLALHLEPLESLLLVFEPLSLRRTPSRPPLGLSFRGTPPRRVPRNPQSQRRRRRTPRRPPRPKLLGMTGGPLVPDGTGCPSSPGGTWI